MEPTFFPTPADLRVWLERNHEKEKELLVGFYKKGSGKPSITWPELVDEALCFGWIDGIRRGIDDERYTIRLTPRKPTSNWSSVNIRRVGDLTSEGRMTPAGLAAFEKRSEHRSGIYAYEQRKQAKLEPDQEREFRANAEAWSFFQAQPAGYRQTATYWVVNAKREETRRKRLATLIDDSASGRRLRHLTRP
ncbi:MAG: hypothetical protein QOI19_2313 [Thermoleophilaceae bacterium]|nr:hypothetical protein [Thermoleophilaceae bacterium]